MWSSLAARSRKSGYAPVGITILFAGVRLLLANGSWTEHPGLKSETWATHSIFVRTIFLFH
jgi:hypothetical protein